MWAANGHDVKDQRERPKKREVGEWSPTLKNVRADRRAMEGKNSRREKTEKEK